MIDLTPIPRRAFLMMPLVSAMVLGGCKPAERVSRISGPAMGTTFNVVVSERPKDLSDAELEEVILRELAEVNRQMSNWEAGSEISRFNAQTGLDPVPISPALEKVMTAAERVHDQSEGRFDTTLGPLIRLWGFGSDGARRIPSDDEIARARAQSGQAHVLELGPGTLRKRQPGAQVYLAAIAKGYGVDRVAGALESLGIQDYLVEIGGDLYASGVNPDGQPWQIGVETPSISRPGVSDVVAVSGMGLASSGDYRNYFEEDGQRFSHLIDPMTGRPVIHKTASATVLAENAMFADAWATAMLILGREDGLRVAERENIAVLFIDRDDKSPDIGFSTVASTRFLALTGLELQQDG